MECIEGNWYKSQFGNYFKCRVNCRSPRFYHSERIRPGLVGKEWGLDEDDFLYDNIKCEISIDEIQDFLPPDHPDKFKKAITENMEYLIPILNKIK
jgi:hypothetical protein